MAYDAEDLREVIRLVEAYVMQGTSEFDEEKLARGLDLLRELATQ